jgi:hypothetical protein
MDVTVELKLKLKLNAILDQGLLHQVEDTLDEVSLIHESSIAIMNSFSC